MDSMTHLYLLGGSKIEQEYCMHLGTGDRIGIRQLLE